MRIRCWLVVACGVALASCSSGAGGPGQTTASWVGAITTEGNVTTVINEAGSVWGGEARLEETLSIGAAAGDEPYLFGRVNSVGATADRIYVVESQLNVVRVYGMSGAHLYDIGGEGQGPGEFDYPWTMDIGPDGRLLVHDRRRVTVFDSEGAVVDTWPLRGGGHPLVVAADGTAFVSSWWREGDESVFGVVGIAPDGAEGRRIAGPDYDPLPWRLDAVYGDRGMGTGVPYAPASLFAVLPSGAIVRGIGDVYRFEIEHPDGRRTIIERPTELPPVPEAQREWLTRYWTAMMRSVQPDWSWTANPVPEHKPAFDELAGDRHGRIWVRRSMGTEVVEDCDANPTALEDARSARSCWRDERGYDVFDESSGRFLGHVAVPEEATPRQWPAFLEDGIVMVAEDAAGTVMVKRYRLVLPAEGASPLDDRNARALAAALSATRGL